MSVFSVSFSLSQSRSQSFMLEVFLKRLQVVSVMEQLIGNRVHEWGLLTSGFGSGVTGGGEIWSFMGNTLSVLFSTASFSI